MPKLKVKLTRKLALTMNGIDVSRLSVGDVIELPHEQARMMIDCGWAEPVVQPFMTNAANQKRHTRCNGRP